MTSCVAIAQLRAGRLRNRQHVQEPDTRRKSGTSGSAQRGGGIRARSHCELEAAGSKPSRSSRPQRGCRNNLVEISPPFREEE